MKVFYILIFLFVPVILFSQISKNNSITISEIWTEPVKVLQVVDGDTILVEGSIGGVPAPISVRLLYVDTPELHYGIFDSSKLYSIELLISYSKQAKEHLSKIFEKNPWVKLYSPSKKFSVDVYNRVLAIVYPKIMIDDPEIISDYPNKIFPEYSLSINEELIGLGLSVLWLKYDLVPSNIYCRWKFFENYARNKKYCLWKDAEGWMIMKLYEVSNYNKFYDTYKCIYPEDKKK